MRIIADEMISPKIVRVVSETIIRSGWQFESVYTANLDGRADEDWVATFARTGGHAYVSGDRKMLKRRALVEQISKTGLVGIYLPSFYAVAKREVQLSYMVYWWPKIEKQIEDASPGSAWITPKGMGGGEIRQHSLQKASKTNVKKANR